jgi:glucose/arabinose dehydrogenase
MTYALRRRLVLAGTLGTLLAAPWPAAAQQPAPLPPGSPLIGRPDTPAAQKLAPVPAPPIAAAADKLPVDKLKAPKGFKIEVYAGGMPNARSLALGDKGTVFVGSRLQDKVYAIVDKDGKREAKVIASGLYRPNGVAFKNGTLYIMELSQLSKIDNVEDKLDNPPKPTLSSTACRRTRRTAGNIWRSGRTTSSISRSGNPATTACRPRATAPCAASISTAAAWRRSPRVSATRLASTGTRSRRRCTSPTTAATGCRRTFPTTNSTA